MKRLFTIIAAVLLTATIWAQSPQRMSYQAVIRNNSDQLVTNHAVGMRVSILQGSSSGTVVYTETQTPTTNANGLVSIEIGGGTGFDAINWANYTFFIKTETDPTGGTSYSIIGTSQLLSVPYALYAKTAETSNDAVKITGDQTIAGNKTFSGTTTVIPPVNGTDAATKAYVDASFEQLYAQGALRVKDYEGNYYNTIKIGNQIWMAENLKTTKYNDGTAVPLVTNSTAWAALSTPGYCWYNNDATTNKATYGALYNWLALDATANGGKNVCPIGWHVSTDAEWTTMTTYLGGESVAGDKLKETGTTHWSSPNTGATNETGFTALPGGVRANDGAFYGIVDGTSDFGAWWSSTENSTSDAWYRDMDYNSSTVDRVINWKRNMGFSVRCLRDF